MIDKINVIRRSYRIDGGAERSVSEYLDSFDHLGISATLICEHWMTPQRQQIVGIATHGNRASRLEMFVEACQKLMGSSDDIFHSHEWIPGSQVVRLGDGLHSDWVDILKAKRGWFGSAIVQTSRFHRLKLELEQSTLLNPALRHIIVNSNYVGDAVKRRYPQVSQKIRLIRNVVPSVFLKATPRRPRSRSGNIILGFVGSGWDRKGLEILLTALAELPECFLLNVIGTDKAHTKYSKICISNKIDHRVNFLGVCDDMPSHYSNMDLLVHPAHYDPAPNVATEAMAMGTPVLGSNQTGIVDFQHLDGVNICSPTAKILAPAILSAINSYSAEQSEGLKQFAGNFSPSYLDQELGKIYGG